MFYISINICKQKAAVHNTILIEDICLLKHPKRYPESKRKHLHTYENKYLDIFKVFPVGNRNYNFSKECAE